jgi:hypothetical protein
MRFTKKNLTGIFISLWLLLFLGVHVEPAQAMSFVCVGTDEDAGCRTIQALDITQAKAQCVAGREVAVRGICYSNFRTDSYNDRGCVNPEGGCTDVSAPSAAQAATLCSNIDPLSVVINRKCLPPLIPPPDGQAITLGCLERSGSCRNGNYSDFNQAVRFCHGYNMLLSGLCPAVENPALPVSVSTRTAQFGCIKTDESCVEVSAGTVNQAFQMCRDAYGTGTRLDIAGCGVEKNYACFKNDGQCEDIRGNLRTVTAKCKTFCPNGGLGCYVDVETNCANSLLTSTPITGETVEGLKQKAATVLNAGGFTTPANLISRAVNLLTAFIGSITLVLYVIAGLLWMTARGNSEQADRAKRILVWTTLGVAVMLCSYIIVNFLFSSIPK